MLDELKIMIDLSEDKPKIKELLLDIAKLPEDKQQNAIDLIKMLIGA